MASIIVKNDAGDRTTGEDDMPPDDADVLQSETIQVAVGTTVHSIRVADILNFFWTQARHIGLLCVVCSQPFGGKLGPSIRTVSVNEEFYRSDKAVRHVHVHDRHRQCVAERDGDFLAVSHVWHEAVRTAHDTRQSNPEACSLVLNSPFKILQSARESFGPGIEIWHDYLSVSQWCFEIQQEILLLIPVIYHLPTRILVYLDDFAPRHAQVLAEFASILDRDIDTRERLEERYTAVVAFYLCRWMKRVWVTLELARSRRACLMDSSYKIWKLDTVTTGSFAHLSQQCHRNYIMLYSHFPERQDFMQSIRYVSRGQDSQFRGRSLGDTMDELATRQCKYHRDRFLAIHASLALQTYDNTVHNIPLDAAGACRWVWIQAMLRGDCSPLLLQPIGEHEKEAFNLSWLVGHEHMNFHTWDLGRPISPAQRPSIVREGDIIAPELDYVATIVAMHPFPLETGPTSALIALVELFLDMETWSPGLLIDIMEAVFPIYQFIDKFAEATVAGYRDLPITRAQYLEQDPAIETKIMDCLKAFIDSANSPSRETLQQDSANKLIAILRLEEKFGPMANDNRLRDITKRFRQRRGLDPGFSEQICSMRCQYCQKAFLMRHDLRRDAKVNAKLYQIPGLSYSMTSSKGVGILVDEKGRIVGRARQAARFCSCHRTDRVEIY